VLAGTRKGLFVLESDDKREKWELSGPLLEGWEVFHAIVDPRDGSMHACTNHPVYGPTTHVSHDRGTTWTRAGELGLPEGSELTLQRTWHIEPGRESEPGTLWLGGAPGVLFKSRDSGTTWKPVPGLVDHPTRERWNPGAGGMCTHSIQLDPRDPDRAFVGISAAGVFRTEDDGETWTPANKGTAADFLPDPYPDLGQCVHKVLLHPADSDRLWQQNHCGVYRSDDGGDSWERLDGNGLPSSFGFPIALNPRDPETAYVIPMVGGDNRVVCDGRLGVYKTSDGGDTWSLASNGLPERAWTGVLREGLASDELDPFGIYFGTQSGSIYASTDEGESWRALARELPPILSVEVGGWS
jgi:photosystem II stability/assembly factor-like uncharacterized protein